MSSAFSETMRMIKIEHSVFALPYALVSAFWAAGGWPSWQIILLILAAMVSARSAAMAFNRYLDADIDARNPRTTVRSIPAGRLSKSYALGFTLICCAIFLAITAMINRLTFMLSPLFLLILLGYSWSKRFTSLCHLLLGLALGLSPLGAWAAVTGQLDWAPVWLGLAVMSWTAGFDMIYACQDIEFDRSEGLFSIPAKLGVNRTLAVARVFHLAMLAILVWLGIYLDQGWFYGAGVGLVAVLLIYEHALVWGGNLEKVDVAFFTMNGLVSLLFGLMTIAGVLLSGSVPAV